MPHIQIITAADESFRPSYMVARLADMWREKGYRVTVGPAEILEADIGVVHVDRTEVPASLIPANPHRRPLLNAAITDISKRAISNRLLDPGSDYRGEVIVKTNANAFGARELRELSKLNPARVGRRLTRWLPWQLVRQLPKQSYPILPSARHVPGWVWRRDDLVVERFLPERVGRQFALRVWLFFGDREYGVRMFSDSGIVKAKNITHYEYLDRVPESLRRERRRLGMDFGKFDYVVVDGEAILLDVNKTPTVGGGGGRSGRLPGLADAIDDFLTKERQC